MRLALERIYKQHRQGLYSLALSITRCPVRSEDAIQEAFMRLCRSKAAPKNDPVAYVFASVRNAAIDVLRKASVVQTDRISLYNDNGQEKDPPGTLIDTEDTTRLRCAVDNLPDPQRQAIVMKIYAGLTFKQIADVCGEPLSTISSRYQRALDRLRESLGDMS